MAPQYAMKCSQNVPNMFKFHQNVQQPPIRSIYDKYFHYNISSYIVSESQNKEYLDYNVITSANPNSFEEFNKFSTAKIESSELNSRELKTSKLIKNPSQTDYDELSIEEIEKYAFTLAKDQAGCRFLQRRLDEIPSLAGTILARVLNCINIRFSIIKSLN